MFLIIANTYMQSYGSELHLFGSYNTKEDCIERMKKYNSLADTFLKELTDLGESPEEIWTDGADAPDNVKEIMEFDQRRYDFIKSYANKGLVIGDYYYTDDIFTFDLNKAERYIIDASKVTKPIYLGGHCE